jgi:hypothetical protein
MGLTGSELMGALATEGAFQLMERKMSDMTKDMLRSVLAGVGAVMVWAGWMDAASVQEWVGAMLTIASFGWAWMDHA